MPKIKREILFSKTYLPISPRKSIFVWIFENINYSQNLQQKNY